MRYRFGPFELDDSTGALTGPDGPIPLRRQTFRLLEVLLEHAPALVDRDTLLDEAWGRTALSANVLPQAVSELRQALGDSASDPSVIETLHRRGYRIIPDVQRTESAPLPKAASADSETGTGAPSRSAAVLLLAGLGVAVLAAAWWWSGAEQRWLENDLLPAVDAAIEDDVTAAWRLVRSARERIPDDPRLEQLWLDLSVPIPLSSDPEGALIEVAGYGPGPADWVPIGTTPMEPVRLPLAALRFRVSRPGFRTRVLAPHVLPFPEPFRLQRIDDAPEGMVFVSPGPVRHFSESRTLEGFWIDRNEVTNAEYLAFIEAGGYDEPALWPEQVDVDGATLDRDQLMQLLVDATGMQGPSTWALGIFPEGEADHPVEGVSWYEAAAYAEWAGKSLPTAFHWSRAAGQGGSQAALFSDVILASNFGNAGTLPVGASGGLGPFGTYDMAGNVREWTATPSGSRRVALGAAWNENSYQFVDWQLTEPISRSAGAGFRLVRTDQPIDPSQVPEFQYESQWSSEPVDDSTFEIYSRLYDYDNTPLNAEVLAVDDDHASWRRERIEFDAAYGEERVILQLFLPKDVEPPYQTVVHFPGGDGRLLDDSRDAGLMLVEPFLRTGRAVAYPVYKGTFERGPVPSSGPVAVRDLIVQQVKDVGRTLDYLETRADIDGERLAWHAVSYGATRSPFILAVEPRFRVAMLVSTGLVPTAHLPPEIQQIDYLARVTVPTLLITGRNDLTISYEDMQVPFFEALGLPDADKRHVALDSGHLPAGYVDVSRHLVEWTDRWLGPVADGRYAQVAPPTPSN